MDRAGWCYVCGLITAQWDRLMDRRDLLALLKADSEEERRTRLRASLLFAEMPANHRPAEQVQEAFEAVVRRVAGLSPDNRIADLFVLEREWEDFRNSAKSTLLGQAGPRPGTPPQTARPGALSFEACWQGEAQDPRLKPFTQAARMLLSDLPREGDRRGWVDRIVDAHEVASLVAAAAVLESDLLLEWVATWARLRAAHLLMRAKRLGWPAADFLAQWQRLGFDSPPLGELAAGDEAAWPVLLRHLGLPAAERILAEPEAMVRLSRHMDERITELTLAAKGMAFGPEPVFAFLWALRNEVINLRLTLSAAAYGIPEERVSAEWRTGFHG